VRDANCEHRKDEGLGREVRNVLKCTFHCKLGGTCQSGKDKSRGALPSSQTSSPVQKDAKKMTGNCQRAAQVRGRWRIVTSAGEL